MVGGSGAGQQSPLLVAVNSVRGMAKRFSITVVLAALALLILVVTAGTATAKPPPNADWTYLRKDAYVHYACKTWDARRGLQVRTATWWNGNRSGLRHKIGAYAAAARSSNRRLARSSDSNQWKRGYLRMRLVKLRRTDRIWVQGSYYGPPAPWSDGVKVQRIRAC